ncbi:STING domain-containing protein [Confluentibacter citreus]|uniref:STING domain-containing protein n=1 Tax=Confluentibacter citreus TaxID=2007307 RepID=UPI000C28DDF8|nr:STING domain-containing protein [Confluentibacter citreus]
MKLSFKFFPIKDLFYSVVPTAGTYGSYIQGIAPEFFPNIWIAIIIGIILSIILAMVFYYENVKAYKKSLAEILATGYFMNFTGRLGKLLKTKTPIHFSFPDGSIKTFTSDAIRVEIGMPVSLASLNAYSEKVEMTSDIVYVREQTSSEPFWIRANVEDNKLVIYEFPRTLFSISRYMKEDFTDVAKAEKNSKRIYSFFHEKIDQLRIEYSSEISNSKLNFLKV